MSNQIVQVNVSLTQAPAPSTLQRTGAFISQGATNTSPGTKSLLTQLADLTPLLVGAKAISGITQTGGLATATAASPHGFTISDTFDLTIAGSTIAAYNGTFLATITSTTQFTYAVPSATASPATGTIVYTPEDVAELLAMATSFFAQGSAISVYVLELGAGNPTDGVAFLTAWINASPQFFYSYLVPRTWDGNAAFLTMIAQFLATTAKTYFFVTTTIATYQFYTNLMKDVVSLIEAPVYGVWPANGLTAFSQSGGAATATTTAAHGVVPGDYFTLSGCTPVGWNGTWLALTGTTGSTLAFAVPSSLGAESVLGTLVASYYGSAGIPAIEFSLAQPFNVALNYNPSTTNKVTPFAFSFLYGDTPFPTLGNSALLALLKLASINIVATGAEGGISDAILEWGTTMDARDFTFWYSVDWMQINAALAIANEVINGSNDPINPLYYDQNGINRLQARLAQVVGSAITFGLALGTVQQTELDGPDFAAAIDAGKFAGGAVVNAVPFIPYSAANPSDYRIGKYAGLSILYTPARGFISIIINIVATDFTS